MEQLTIKGEVKMISETRVISDKFEVCDIVITTEGNYPQHILFTAVNDNIDKVKAVSVGQDVNVEFTVRGREWTSPQGEVKYFNTLDVREITALSPVPVQAVDDLPF